VALLLRFLDARGLPRLGEHLPGATDADARVQPLIGDLFGELRPDGPALPAAGLRLLAPVAPSKVVGVGSNYRDHAREMGKAVPDVPRIFLKPSTSVIGPGAPIPIPPGTSRVDHEAELGVVIGRHTSRVRADDALLHVLGYTVVNDVTARDMQRSDGVFARAKGFDGFCPLGPWIRTDLDPGDLAVRAWVDGELRQDGRTSDMVFGVAELIAFISGVMTLLPGDVIATGTPAGVGPLMAGQVVEVEVEGVGRLRSPVVNRDDRPAGA
jgi:2-keto-4-pentenoate hydratase/2-oxohepta-3-ene-1,7-dioic acid hydratase in catechol pathway